jgi:hypothetical protein
MASAFPVACRGAQRSLLTVLQATLKTVMNAIFLTRRLGWDEIDFAG